MTTSTVAAAVVHARRALAALIGCTVALLLAGVASASAATVVVSPPAMHSWTAQTNDANGDPVAFGTCANGAVSFVPGPGTAPLGAGSAELTTGDGTTGGDCAAQLRSSAYAGVKLSDLTALGYSTYVEQNNGSQAPYVALLVNNEGNGSGPIDDILFFEPPYQTPASGNASLPDQGAVAYDTWQSWNALAGGWWSNTGDGGGPGDHVQPLSHYLALHPGAVITDDATYGPGGGVAVLVGYASAPDRFDSAVDAFTIGINGASTTYDFEPAKRTTATAISCSPSPVGADSATTCTATVDDTAAGTKAAPGGSVSFTGSSGSFSPSATCTLSATGNPGESSCSVSYAQPMPGAYSLTAAYAGDATHQGSSGQATVDVTAPASTPGCRILGHGRIIASNGDRAAFVLYAQAPRTTHRRHAPAIELYRDAGPAGAFRLLARDTDAVTCEKGSPASGSVFGTAKLDGSTAVRFRIDVTATAPERFWHRDEIAGGPRSSSGGTYRLRLSNGYDSGVQPLGQRGRVEISLHRR